MPDSTQLDSFPPSVLMAEIAQQPDTWLTTLQRVISTPFASEPRPESVIVTGAGTSAYAAAAIAGAWPGATAIPTTDLLLQAEDTILALFSPDRPRLLISLARSGDSPESTAVVERVLRLCPEAAHLAIVCNPGGRLARLPHVRTIPLDPRTNDQSLAMTSSFSNLALAGLCLAQQHVLEACLPAICSSVRAQLQQTNRIAHDIASSAGERVLVLTSRMHALAAETCIKILELTRGRSILLPETFLGLRHGPISFLREDSLVLCFASSDPEVRRYEIDLVSELRARKLGRTVVIADSPAGWECDWFVPAAAAGLDDALRTPFEIPFSQLLAYHLSARAGIDPDNPSPDGTVTRVVSQFKIHPDRIHKSL